MSLPPIIKSSAFSGVLTSIAESDPGVFSAFERSTLPPRLSLDGLVAWLSNKLNSKDDVIRSKMNEINGKKDAEKKLHELISRLQSSASHSADGGGNVEIPAELGDPNKVHESELYQSLDEDGKKAIDDLLGQVQHDGWHVNADTKTITLSDGRSWEFKKGDFIPPEVAAAAGDLVKDGADYCPTRINKDTLTKAIESLQTTANAVGANDEVQMISLQTMISQRAQLVQLVSNMVASANESAKTIIGNTRT